MSYFTIARQLSTNLETVSKGATSFKLFVVTHKPCNIPQEGDYTPIHVGRYIYGRCMADCGRNALKPDDPMAWIQGDDTGENIYEKNLQYCEMTDHYREICQTCIIY